MILEQHASLIAPVNLIAERDCAENGTGFMGSA